MADDNYFVGVHSPTRLRREILEASRETLKLIQKHYDIIEMRKRKEELIHKLENEVKEIIVLYNKLETFLPEKSVVSKKKRSDIDQIKIPKPKKHKKVAVPKPIVKEKEMTKLERLEQALSAIENKLDTLN